MRSPKVIALILALACAVSAQKRKKKPIPLVSPAPQDTLAKPGAAPAAPPPGTVATADEISFGKTLVIEGRVEKPAVQFPLLKEPPPEKEIQFEASFLQNILKLDRENTFDAGERYGRE